MNNYQCFYCNKFISYKDLNDPLITYINQHGCSYHIICKNLYNII